MGNFDPSRIKVPRITENVICTRADEFRSQFHNGTDPFVDVLQILEFDIGIEIRPVPGLKSECDTDAFINLDFTVVFVDKVEYMDERFQSRLRYTIAHEIGHKVLHEELIRANGINTVEDWVEFIRLIPDYIYRSIEWQANEFAGRFLVPVQPLTERYNRALTETRNKLDENGYTGRIDVDLILSEIAGSICREFQVSQDVMKIRLEREGFWPPATT